jgi:arylsulfatase
VKFFKILTLLCAALLVAAVLTGCKGSKGISRIDLIDELAHAREQSSLPAPIPGQDSVVFQENFENAPAQAEDFHLIKGDAAHELTEDYAFDGKKSFLISDPEGGSEAVLNFTVPVKPLRYYCFTAYVKAKDLSKLDNADRFGAFLATAAVQESPTREMEDPWGHENVAPSAWLHFPEQGGQTESSGKGWRELKIYFRTEPGAQFAKVHLIFSAFSPAIGKVYFDGLSLTELHSMKSLSQADRLNQDLGAMGDFAKRWQSQGVTRRCLFTPAGTSIIYDLSLPKKAVLRFEPGLLFETDSAASQSARYQVLLKDKVIFDKAFSEIAGKPQTIPVPDSSGRKVILQLSVKVGAAEDPLAAPMIWLDPVIMSESNASEKLNLVVITLESVRADHLGAYGYKKRPTSPRIDQLAAHGVLFEDLFVQRANTTISLCSIFSSTYPAWNGVQETTRIPKDIRTMTQEIRDQGYETGAFHYLGDTASAGFDEFFSTSFLSFLREDLWGVVSNGLAFNQNDARMDEILLDKSLKWIDAHSDRPFFAWIFLVAGKETSYPPADPKDLFPMLDYHGPLSSELGKYLAQDQKINSDRIVLSDADRDFFESLYDARVRVTDRNIGRIIDFLKTKGLDRNTLVVIFSDHGTDLWDAKLPPGYPMSAYDQALHIPFIIYLPGAAPEGTRVKGLAEGVDIAPTILDIMKIKGLAKQAQGRSLWPAALGKSWSPREFVVSELDEPLMTIRNNEWRFILNRQPDQAFYQWAHTYQPDVLGPNTDWKLIPDNSLKLLWWTFHGWASYNGRELYHLTEPGGVSKDVITQFPDRASELEATLLAWEKTYRRKIKPEQLDANAIKLMRETGYLPKK